ncbi:hypothetical protein [Paenibacillus xylanexedens]|uniref:hypothetical protein n=1 Tax=Paenibacillus xylanexedens TaxID=528191 RepID=UPI0016427DF7|nr:hypothetical protein [Paenibacillus xylanexedens]
MEMDDFLNIKRMLMVMCCTFLVTSLITPAISAREEFDIVEAKQELVNRASLKSKNLVEINVDIDYTLAKLTAEAKDEEEITDVMESLGVYKLEIPKEYNDEFLGALAIDNSNITMTKPNIYYDSNSKEWVVVGGGYWKNDNWIEHNPLVWPGIGRVGETYNVGGVEGFGVGYTSMGDTYKSKINSVYGYISDGNGNEVTTSNRSDGDGSKGFGFQIQDKIRVKKTWPGITPTTEYFSYIGKHFAGLARYSSDFSSSTGVATTYYVHTWNSTSIDSVKFGVSSKTAGVDVSYKNAGSSFPAFSNDVRF